MQLSRCARRRAEGAKNRGFSASHPGTRLAKAPGRRSRMSLSEVLSEPLRFWLISLLVDTARYVIPAGGAFLVFWVWGAARFSRRLIQGKLARAEKLWHDIRWSASTVLIFSFFGLAVRYGGNFGILRRYETVAERGWAYFALTVIILIVVQDAYFYWTHRAMHHPLLYRWVHREHHVSTNTSPWTAYAFAPAEAVVHALIVPLVWLVLPMHQMAVFLFLVFMVLRNVLGHLAIELYPSGFTKSRFWGAHTTTTHHAMHHQYFSSNYGLYFTFWDRLMGTMHPDYDQRFERVVSG
jgi:Delta7-sterol 5-desaturase